MKEPLCDLDEDLFFWRNYTGQDPAIFLFISMILVNAVKIDMFMKMVQVDYKNYHSTCPTKYNVVITSSASNHWLQVTVT